jgi:transcriptional regulator GlxA family with amidase domain
MSSRDICVAIARRWGYDPEDVLPTGGVIGLAPVHRRALLDGMRGALDVAAGGTKTSSEMEQELVASLVDALVSASGLLPQPGRRYRGVEYVKRSQDYVEAHLDADIRAADLAEAAESSVRTVQSSFRKLLGVSPMQYVRIRRLGRLRRSLLSRGKGQTVTRLALEHGINHMGRLSVEYHGLFGECPRETGR